MTPLQEAEKPVIHNSMTNIKDPTKRVRTQSIEAVRSQTAGLQPQRGEGGGVRQGGGQLSEAPPVHFLCELSVTGDVQQAESGESSHHPS